MVPSSSQVSLRDIAQKLGVSPTTVSLALRNHPRISEATRSRVKMAAKELGYVPNPVVSHLGSLRWKNSAAGLKNNVALIVPAPLPSPSVQARSDDRDCWLAFHDRARAQGYAAECYALSDYRSLDHLVGVLHHRGVRGVAFTRMADPSVANHPGLSRLAVVEVNFGHLPTMYHKVQLDRFGEIGTAVAKSVASGFSRVALVLLDEPTASDRPLRVASYMHHLKTYGKSTLPIFDLKIPEELWPSEASRLRQFIQKHRIEVVIALNGLVAHILDLADVSVPETVSLIDLAAHPAESTTGLVEDFHALGEAVIDTLDSLIRTGQHGSANEPRTVILGKRWIEGLTMVTKARTARDPVITPVAALGS